MMEALCRLHSVNLAMELVGILMVFESPQSSIEKTSVFIVYSALCRAIKSSIEKTLFLEYNLFLWTRTLVI